MNENKGFTLIELLAVIIILGVLMIIAIPSVTEYISSSRKNAYAEIATRYVDGVRNKINSAEIAIYDPNATYYVPGKCVNMEKGGDSPYGDWKDYYVVVTYDGNSYNYYFTGYDDSNQGIYLTHQSLLNSNSIKSGVTSISTDVGVGDRDIILVVDDSCKNTLEAKPAISIIAENGMLDEDTGSDIGGDSTGGDSTASTLLSDVVSVGDYVNYDAGNWESTVSKPTSSDMLKLGGYTSGQSRNKSISCFNGYENPASSPMQDGWRVLKISGTTVTLIHAGSSECFGIYDNSVQGYIWNFIYNAESFLGKTPSGPTVSAYPSGSYDFSYYLNDYASKVEILDKAMIEEYLGYSIGTGTKISDDLIKTNVYYWIAKAHNESNLYYLEYNGNVGTASANIRGIRPVITLKSTVKTTGKATDSYGHESWQLSQQ